MVGSAEPSRSSRTSASICSSTLDVREKRWRESKWKESTAGGSGYVSDLAAEVDCQSLRGSREKAAQDGPLLGEVPRAVRRVGVGPLLERFLAVKEDDLDRRFARLLLVKAVGSDLDPASGVSRGL
jgi:hypothetical protein